MWVSMPWAEGAHTNKMAHLGPGSTCPDARAGSGGGAELVTESWHDLRLREGNWKSGERFGGPQHLVTISDGRGMSYERDCHYQDG